MSDLRYDLEDIIDRLVRSPSAQASALVRRLPPTNEATSRPPVHVGVVVPDVFTVRVRPTDGGRWVVRHGADETVHESKDAAIEEARAWIRLRGDGFVYELDGLGLLVRAAAVDGDKLADATAVGADHWGDRLQGRPPAGLARDVVRPSATEPARMEEADPQKPHGAAASGAKLMGSPGGAPDADGSEQDVEAMRSLVAFMAFLKEKRASGAPPAAYKAELSDWKQRLIEAFEHSSGASGAAPSARQAKRPFSQSLWFKELVHEAGEFFHDLFEAREFIKLAAALIGHPIG